jgi:dipeptidase D
MLYKHQGENMSKIMEYFQQLTQIPHCSYEAGKLRDFLLSFGASRGYDVFTDEVDNIMIKKQGAKLALQAHYDMVCVGRAPKIETYIEDGWMYAKESTLGADNGMAIAMMMALMDEQKVCEFLFTSDEEVGLIGADACAFELASSYMLNLDSEDEAEVYIGCAGGIDIKATKKIEKSLYHDTFYEITVGGLPGGHSGVEIHKDIPNAIKLFAKFLKDKDIKIASLQAGERINSIPVNVKAIVSYHDSLESSAFIEVEKIAGSFEACDGRELIEMLDSFQNGVLTFNDTLQVPDTSINLALMRIEDDTIMIEASARAMDAEGLASVKKSATKHFQEYGYHVEHHGKYPAWKPEINDFSHIVNKAMQEVFGKSAFKAIHAGLECAILSDHYPQIKITSIGPNIRSPHSIHEKVEIASVEKTYRVVQKVIDALE